MRASGSPISEPYLTDHRSRGSLFFHDRLATSLMSATWNELRCAWCWAQLRALVMRLPHGRYELSCRSGTLAGAVRVDLKGLTGMSNMEQTYAPHPCHTEWRLVVSAAKAGRPSSMSQPRGPSSGLCCDRKTANNPRLSSSHFGFMIFGECATIAKQFTFRLESFHGESCQS